MSILLTVCLSIYLSIFLTVCLSICLFSCMSVYLSVYLYVYLFNYLSVYLSNYMSVYLSNYLSIYLSRLLSGQPRYQSASKSPSWQRACSWSRAGVSPARRCVWWRRWCSLTWPCTRSACPGRYVQAGACRGDLEGFNYYNVQ